MFVIISNILILLIFTLNNSDQVSAAPILDFAENKLDFNFDNKLALGNFASLFPDIDPSIAEDARLETVLDLFSFYFSQN